MADIINTYLLRGFKRVTSLGVMLLVVAVHALSQGYDFNTFTTTDGLPQSYVYSVVQDYWGYLWVGTGDGLSRYNGVEFENFSNRDSLADNFITCAAIEGKGIWFGHSNGDITFYNGKDFQAVHTLLPEVSPVTYFAGNPDGRIWMSTYAGYLIELDTVKGAVNQHFFKDPHNIVTFCFTAKNELLAGTNSGLIRCKLNTSGKIEVVRIYHEIPETKIAGILKKKDATGFLIATENEGLYELSNKDELSRIDIFTAGARLNLTGVQTVFEDSRSVIWLSTFGNGLVRLEYDVPGQKTRVSQFHKSNGFVTDNVKTIFEDREGNLWSGNFGEGLTRITPKIFNVYRLNKALYGKTVVSVYNDGQNQWLGTENGLLKLERPEGKVLKFYGKGTGMPQDAVTAIYRSDVNTLWIGTEQNGLYRLETGSDKISKYSLGNGALENSVTCIAGRDDQVWAGTKKGLCKVNTIHNSLKWFTISQGGMPHNFINSLYFDKTGKLWVTTHSNLLVYIQDDQVHKFPLNFEGSILTFGPLTGDADSNLWVGSEGQGVFCISPDSVMNITAKQGLLSEYCYSIVADDSNNIWIGHKGGLSRIRIRDLFIKPFRHMDGTSADFQFNANAAGKDGQGTIWFGSGEGLVAYNPATDLTRPSPPVPKIISIRINDEEKDISSRIVLPPGKYKIRIQFFAVNLKEPSLVSYQYKLNGYEDWTEVTKNTSVTYTNLSYGKYTFYLKASNGDGMVSLSPLTIGFIIKVPFWRQWWFFPVVVLLAGSLIFVYIKQREYRFKMEKAILEEKVQERTKEIQSQKNQIEQQHNLIREKNAEITSSIVYARHIQRALLPTNEHLNRLLPENFVLLKPKDIVSGDFYWISEKHSKIVFTVADCTGHGVPGAFMSVLSINILNEIVNMQGITQSDQIVNKLHAMINRSLKKSKMDGLDLTLCVWDKNTGKLQYTGAMNPLIHIHDGKLDIVNADPYSVNSGREDFIPFKVNEIEIKAGDMLYLFTDGYVDQFGGERDKKFTIRRLLSALLEIHQLPVCDQNKMLEDMINDWMNGRIQTDDITMMGVRF